MLMQNDVLEMVRRACARKFISVNSCLPSWADFFRNFLIPQRAAFIICRSSVEGFQPVKPSINGKGLFMKSHEVVRKACQRKGCKQVAAGMKVSVDLVHKWGRGRADGRSVELNPPDRMVSLMECTGDLGLLHWLCQQAGGFFVANPPVKSLRTAKDLLPVEKLVLGEQAGLFVMLVQALGQRLSRAEVAELGSRGERRKSDMERPVASGEREWLPETGMV